MFRRVVPLFLRLHTTTQKNKKLIFKFTKDWTGHMEYNYALASKLTQLADPAHPQALIRTGTPSGAFFYLWFGTKHR